MKPLQVFIGYDAREAIAYHVLSHSIMQRASRPVSITPVNKKLLVAMGVWLRDRNPLESTDFAMTRFLTPWLSDFARVSIFMDCDMLCLGDICELADIAMSQPQHDVFVVKHAYTPSTVFKFLGQKQTNYPCKNWSSLMVFNGHRMAVRQLTPSFVNLATPANLHRFEWTEAVGELPVEWNHLVGEYPTNPAAKLVHFTLGGPWFSEDELWMEYSEEWLAEMESILNVGNDPAMLTPNA